MTWLQEASIRKTYEKLKLVPKSSKVLFQTAAVQRIYLKVEFSNHRMQ